MSHLCNRCVREFLILARTWFAFGLPSKTGCDICTAPTHPSYSPFITRVVGVSMKYLARWGICLNLNFPSFDGTNPKLWQSKCEKYFNMYAIEDSMWVQVTIMHFEGDAGRWLQSIEPQIASMS
jgi:hypothetical protein